MGLNQSWSQISWLLVWQKLEWENTVFDHVFTPTSIEYAFSSRICLCSVYKLLVSLELCGLVVFGGPITTKVPIFMKVLSNFFALWKIQSTTLPVSDWFVWQHPCHKHTNNHH